MLSLSNIDLPLQQVPFAGFATRFAALQIPATANIVASSMVGLLMTKSDLKQPLENCNNHIWCSPPSPTQLATTVALGSLACTAVPSAAAAGFRSARPFAEDLPNFLFASTVASALGVASMSAVAGGYLTGTFLEDSTGKNAFFGGLALGGIELSLLLVLMKFSPLAVKKFVEGRLRLQDDLERNAGVDSPAANGMPARNSSGGSAKLAKTGPTSSSEAINEQARFAPPPFDLMPEISAHALT